MPSSTHTEKRYAVCVGINTYADTAALAPLHAAEDNATQFAQVLDDLGFPAENRCLLLGSQATLDAINDALNKFILDQPDPNDLVLFYFAGHGVPINIAPDTDEPRSEVFLAPFDFDRSAVQMLSVRTQRALSMERLRTTYFAGEGSRKRLFILDSCHSGDFYGPDYRDGESPDRVQNYILRMLDSRSTGRVALSSCLPYQKARDDRSMTTYVMQALRGDAPAACRPDGCITIGSLFEYLADVMPDDQRPVLSGVQHDTFTLVCHKELASTSSEVQQTPVLSALSKQPRTHRRSFTDLPLIGRDADAIWLHNTPGDRLLVGQSGSGKTFLLRHLTPEQHAFFLVSAEREQIIQAIQAQRPDIIIVDDDVFVQEPGYHRLLLDLIHMRTELGYPFGIVASCWPNYRANIEQALNLPPSQVHELSPLTRDEIVQVISAVGIHGSVELVRELVNQADGRPGLAVTLAEACLNNNIQQVLAGDVLGRAIGQLINPHVQTLLSAFAVGGDRGMSMSVVAIAFQKSVLDIRTQLHQLATSGIIRQDSRDFYTVHPKALRGWLLRTIFFTNDTNDVPLPINMLDQLVNEAPSLPDVAIALIDAKHRGSAVPGNLLTEIVFQASQDRVDEYHKMLGDEQAAEVLRKDPVRRMVLENYAALGVDQAVQVLQHDPDAVYIIAQSALHYIPEQVIPMLLERVAKHQRPIHNETDHPLRLIKDWIYEAPISGTDNIRRRRTLLRAVRIWLSQGGDRSIGFRTLPFIMCPEFEDGQLDPGAGRTVTIRIGYLSQRNITALQALWPDIRDMLNEFPFTDWQPVFDMIELWVYSGRRDIALPAETLQIMHEFARSMLQDLTPLLKGHWGAISVARRLAERLNMELALEDDETFTLLYHPPYRRDMQAEEQRIHAVRALAQRWSHSDVDQVAQRLAHYDHEAQIARHNGRHELGRLGRELAQQVDAPLQWVEIFTRYQLAPELVFPLLEAAADSSPGWVDCAQILLGQPRYRFAVVHVVLTRVNPPEHLLASTLQQLDGCAGLIETLCLRNHVSEPVLEQLLQHYDPNIARAAVWGEWHANPECTVKDAISLTWRDAFVRYGQDEYTMRQIGTAHSDLAFAWLQQRLADPTWRWYAEEDAAFAAIDALDHDARVVLLQSFTPRHQSEQLVRHLVTGSRDLYQRLLEHDHLADLHLVPLSGPPDDGWDERVRLALQKGYSPRDIAYAAVQYRSLSWWGNESNVWNDWIEQFEPFLAYDDEHVQEVAQLAIACLQDRKNDALARERDEDVYGRD